MTNTWISHLNLEKNELWKFDIFHENSWKRTKNTLISHLNLEKNELWKFDIFTWKFMKAYEKCLNFTFELGKERTLKIWYFYMKIHESAWQILESHTWTWKRVNFESLVFFHENSWNRMKNTLISYLNLEKNELWKFEIFTWKFMKAHEKYFNLTSELVKERTLKVWDFYMKIHESAWKILESHIWTSKRTNFESFIFLHENSWKHMTNTWISHLNLEKNELWKFDIFTWKFMKAHEKYLNLTSEFGKQRTLKIWYFSWKFMKAYEKYFNLTSELGKERTLKIWYFYMKIHESARKIL
jgi:hypothetical protein